MYKTILVSLALLASVSCSGNKNIFIIGHRVVVSKPEVEKKLAPKETISGLFLDATCDLHCVENDYLLLKLRGATGFCFRALNLRTKEYVDFLNVGRGPDEVMAGLFSGKRTIKGRTLLDVSAMNEGQLLHIDLGETIRQKRAFILEKEEVIPSAAVSFSVGDDLLSETINDEDYYAFKLYNPKNQIVSRKWQVFGADEYLVAYQPLFSSAMVLKPDGTKLSLSMLFFDEINIIDLVGEEHISISTSRKNKDASILNESLHKRKLGSRYYYMQHAVTNNSILGLYYDCEVSKRTQRSSATVHVFSWDGKFKARYNLDEPITAITVSDDGKTLYGLTEEEILYVYDL
ncbi:MAG: hypothetical protein II841_00625 [Bacteroidales bacterium]|nr:hypothetical protein [Bacteroidales bacterium]